MPLSRQIEKPHTMLYRSIALGARSIRALCALHPSECGCSASASDGKRARRCPELSGHRRRSLPTP